MDDQANMQAPEDSYRPAKDYKGFLRPALGFLGGVALFIVGFFGVQAWHSHNSVSAAIPPAKIEPMPLGGQRPPASFLADFDSYYAYVMELQAEQTRLNQSKAAVEIQVKQRTAVGWAQELGQQIPPGFTFDQPSRSFVPVKKAAEAPTSTPSPATPATPVKDAKPTK